MENMKYIRWIMNKKIIEEEIERQDRQYMQLQKKFSSSEKERLELLNENRILKENIEKYLLSIKDLRKKVKNLKKEMKVGD